MNAPQPPYAAVIFTNRRTLIDDDAYATAAARMEELAARQPGYLGIESVRGDDREGITVSYWTSYETALAWKAETEHLEVQRVGRERWYEWYRVRVATVDREYTYDSSHVSSQGDTDD